ncbi:hypothetical protein TNCV_1249471 [Trichonephila clavipes]|nr:hypothetical protein TNCV_1249471 [Trichonephila clavipes]
MHLYPYGRFRLNRSSQLGVLQPEKFRNNINFLMKLKKSTTKTFQIVIEAYGDETLFQAHVSGEGTVWKMMKLLGDQGQLLQTKTLLKFMIRVDSYSHQWSDC